MSNKTIVFGVIGFFLIIISLFAFTSFQKNKVTEQVPSVATKAGADTTRYGITRIDAKHFYVDGVHTIVGELPLPTPCDLLATDALVAESYPEQVTFAFSVVNTTKECLTQQTVQRFKVSASASKQANLQATFLGQPVELNLIEASAGETPEEFELFIKG